MADTVLAAAQAYLRRGFQPVSIPEGSKGPKTAAWGNIRYTEDMLPRAFSPGKNVGLLVGAASGNLTDVDLDCDEAVMIGATFLPETNMVHGRPARPLSHRWYIIDKNFPGALQFKDPRDDKMIIELRSSDGSKAVQTVAPPSVHAVDGEAYAWEKNGEPARVSGEVLLAKVKEVAAAALLARCFPDNGRHAFCLALAGGLLRRGWDVDRVHDFIYAVAEAGGSDKPDARADVAGYTKLRIDNDEPATGFTTLAGMLGYRASEVINKIHDWLGLEDADAYASNEEHLTELGVAKRLIQEHGAELFYVPENGFWYRWDGKHWSADGSKSIWAYAIETILRIGTEAQKKLDGCDPKLVEIVAMKASKARTEMLEAYDADDIDRVAFAQKALAFSRVCETRAKIAAIVDLAESLSDAAKELTTLDANPDLFNVSNGTIDLRTGIIRPHAPTDFITKISDVVYDPAAKSPLFDQFLCEIMPSAEMRRYLQLAHGYTLTGLTTEQCIFLCVGTGANGKSVLDKVRRAYMGKYGKAAPGSTFLSTRNDGPTNDIAALVGARMVAVSETEIGKSWAEGRIKSMSSGDVVTARFLHKEFFDYVPQFKLWTSSNHKPRIKGGDDGIIRRLRLITFGVQIPEDKQVKDLDEKLIALELSGIFTWAVKGAALWYAEKLQSPEDMKEQVDLYRVNYDTLDEWISEALTYEKDAFVSSADLYESYRRWALKSGAEVISKSELGELLPHKGLIPHRVSKLRTRGWKGAKLFTPS